MAEERAGENELARILVQSSVDGLFAIDRECRYTLWNSAMEEFAGRKAAHVLGRNMFEVFPFLREVGIDRAVERVLEGQVVLLEAVPSALPSGEIHYFDRHYMPLRADGGAVLGMLGIVRDVTSRKVAEEALRASEATLRSAVETAGIGLWRWDARRDEVLWEAPLCAMFGLPVGAGPKTRDEYLALVHPDDRAKVRDASTAGVAHGGWEGEHRILRADGAVRWVMSKTTMVRSADGELALGALMDISDRRQRDEQARRAQKLEAIGQLTAGIAHNFNNILMALHPNIELAARTAPPELTPLLANAEQATARATALVRQLMTFAGQNRPSARTVESLGALARRTVEFCSSTFDRRIVVEGTYDDSAQATVDPAQIEQAVANLLINARDAVGHVLTPRITVEVDRVDRGSPDVGGRTGDFVRVRVRDNGVGMDPATAARIFEPFFTTKEVGEGTGLGLATAHAVIAEHGGFLACDSSPGLGATFSLYLPRAEGEVRLAEAVAPLPPARGAERVLVVDDEAPIRKVVRHMLEAAGYSVDVAASGREALAILADPGRPSPVDLVLLDMSMPGLSGEALRRQVRGQAPKARVVVFTGYTLEEPGEADAVLEKPVTSDKLLATIREVLDRPAVKAG